MHPGGVAVLLDAEIRESFFITRLACKYANKTLSAGQDATEAFYALHRHEVLLRPQYQRLQVGTIKDESSIIASKVTGELSEVPYAEPTWLTKGYYSPYYKEVCLPLIQSGTSC